MNLEGNLFGSVVVGILIASFILFIVYVGGNRVYKEDQMKWMNNPVVVCILWVIASTLTVLRFYFGWL
jgi:hypothetical protein